MRGTDTTLHSQRKDDIKSTNEQAKVTWQSSHNSEYLSIDFNGFIISVAISESISTAITGNPFKLLELLLIQNGRS